MSKPSICLAITGGIACGKSTVGGILQREGVAVCDADDLAHELMLPGKPGYYKVKELFGSAYADEQKGINRRKLGKLVFADEKARENLNKALHPLIRSAWEDWLNNLADACTVAVIIPLLYEIDATIGWTAVICVAADEDIVISRLRDRGLGTEDALVRIRAQMPVEVKIQHSDYVIHNNGSIADLERETRAVMDRALKMKEGIRNG